MAYIDINTKVAKVLKDHPKTLEVFLKHGCPDMRTGFFSVMARIMSLRNAARIHRIPIEELRADLEQVIRLKDDPNERHAET